MLRTILVGLDGSADRNAAIELGIQWAHKFNAMLVGLAVIDQPTSFCLRCAEIGVTYKLLEDVALPSERICLEAQRYDLILLGNQQYPDETLRKIIKTSPRPVVTVPGQLESNGSIVVAYDGSLQAARTLQAFQSLQIGSSQEIHVVSVNADHDEAVRHASRAIDYLGFHEIKAQRHAVTSPSPAPALIEMVKRLGAGLLVMGAYGQPVFKELFFGSVTQAMLAEETVPLFLYH